MRKSRIFKSGYCEITQVYKKGVHDGIDLTDKKYTFGWIVSHSDGTVVDVVSNCNENTNGENGHRLAYIYGNYVKIKHDNGYYTLYAHGSYDTVKVKKGDRVLKGQVIMYMGNTGYSFGGHVHFEVRDTKDVKINPTDYIDSDLPSNYNLKYHVGDNVKIKGIYVSSSSDKMLSPLINHGVITRIKNDSKNPYLLDEGRIGWTNDKCIESFYLDDYILTLVKNTIKGVYGNGTERKNKLGKNYDIVQNQVNLNYKHGTITQDKIRLY